MDRNKGGTEADKREEESSKGNGGGRGGDEKDAECCRQKKKIWLKLLQLLPPQPHRNAFRARGVETEFFPPLLIILFVGM
jgi:hypothetical protein